MQLIGLDTLQTVVLLVMALGVIGGVLPMIPGPLITWLAALVYNLLTGFTPAKLLILAAMTVIMLVGSFADVWLSSAGARRSGASGCTAWIAALAGLVGLVAFSVIGAILLPLVVVLVIEFVRRRDAGAALRAGGGYLAGWALSSVFELIASLAITALWLWQVHGWRALTG